jgi:hypothetical protein
VHAALAAVMVARLAITGVDATWRRSRGRWPVSEGVGVAWIAYDDHDDGLRSSVLDDEGREGGQ